ncbi:MAG: hypothetical protein ACRENE_02505, partial [Polyangiaceae bacterium]
MTSPVAGPAAAPTSGVAFEGALADVYSLLSQDREEGVALGETGVEQNRQEQSKALGDQLAALQREEANQSTSGGGFFQSIGKLVSDVASDLVHGDATSTFRDVSSDLDAAWNSPRFWSDLESGFNDISIVSAG